MSKKTIIAAVLAAACAAAVWADSDPVELPPPATSGGVALADALSARATHREFSGEALSQQQLSDLLWAANGINRPDVSKRTAPTAVNRQEIDVYACFADGAYLYDAHANVLKKVSDEDLRPYTGRMNAGAENFALAAPLAIVYVADFARQAMQDRPMDALRYAAVDCGFIGQNVYLHCAANGLSTVFLGMIDAPAIAKALGLPATSTAMFAQTVGFPAGR